MKGREGGREREEEAMASLFYIRFHPYLPERNFVDSSLIPFYEFLTTGSIKRPEQQHAG